MSCDSQSIFIKNLAYDNGPGQVTASNIGPGIGIFSAKVGDDLQFKSLTSIDNSLTITSTATTVDLSVNVSVGNRIAYSLLSAASNVSNLAPQTIAYFPWSNTRYSGYSNGRLIFWLTGPGTTVTVNVLNTNTALSVGFLAVNNGNNIYSFPIANPVADTTLEIQVACNPIVMPAPIILGITLEYDQ